MIYFPEKYIGSNIFDSLLNACIDFGVWTKNTKGKIFESEEALSCDKLAYFATKLPLDRLVLMSDCGSNVLARSKKDNLWDFNHHACHCLSIFVQKALKSPSM